AAAGGEHNAPALGVDAADVDDDVAAGHRGLIQDAEDRVGRAGGAEGEGVALEIELAVGDASPDVHARAGDQRVGVEGDVIERGVLLSRGGVDQGARDGGGGRTGAADVEEAGAEIERVGGDVSALIELPAGGDGDVPDRAAGGAEGVAGGDLGGAAAGDGGLPGAGLGA